MKCIPRSLQSCFGGYSDQEGLHARSVHARRERLQGLREAAVHRIVPCCEDVELRSRFETEINSHLLVETRRRIDAMRTLGTIGDPPYVKFHIGREECTEHGCVVEFSKNCKVAELRCRLATELGVEADTISLLCDGADGKELLYGHTLNSPYQRIVGGCEVQLCLVVSAKEETLRHAVDTYAAARGVVNWDGFIARCFFSLPVSTSASDTRQHPASTAEEFVVEYSENYGVELFEWINSIQVCYGLENSELSKSLEIIDGRRKSWAWPEVVMQDECPQFPLCFKLGAREGNESLRLSVEGLMNNTRLGSDRRFRVVSVLNNENHDLRRTQTRMKDAIRASGTNITPEQLATSARIDACFGDFDNTLNEHLLFHGTGMAEAAKIVTDQFKLSLAGTANGTFHGRGLYFADRSSKSHSYARPEKVVRAIDHVNLYSMLLCRVVCGNMGPPGSNVSGSSAGNLHSIRAMSPSGADEIVVFNTDQVYPMYLILYQLD